MIWLSEKLEFPSYDSTTQDGIIALGGDLSPERLMYAYQHGIFPWYSENEPIVWYCPTKRMVLFPNDLKVSKSMKSILKRKKFIITENEAFEEVIFQCKTITRKEGYGTWITNEMEKAYKQKLEEALNVGYSILKQNGKSVDAVEATIKILEDSELFNAGKGSVLSNNEEVEMDASIMTGDNLKA